MLVDDQPLVRDGIASLLSARGFDVVGEASDGAGALEKARQLQPDVILMDVRMPGMGGLEATRLIKAEMPEIKVIILTVSDDEKDLFEAIKSGAHGYLLKNLQASEFFDALRGLERGEAPLPRRLATALLDEFRRSTELDRDRAPGAGLSVREMEVLQQVAAGKSNREVAEALTISENTVKFHMKNILDKLHLQNRAQVVAWAASHGVKVSTPGPE